MGATTLRAHFDGHKIVLDEPFDLEPDTELIITVLTKEQFNSEREDWANLAMEALERAYGEDEPEYTPDMIKEANPKYERR